MTRASANKAWGTPSFCQGTGKELRTWELRPRGGPEIYFAGAHRGDATGRPGDVVAQVSWIEIPGWKTTAGVTTASATWSPESVSPRYPHAKVSRYRDGHLHQVLDNSLGVEIEWLPASYESGFIVYMFIFPPGH